MRSPLMTTSWCDLVVATYAAPAGLLAAHLPDGVELELHHGRAYCSLVGFQFQNTVLFGIPSPLFRNFPEVNLRIYCRRGETRGVHFVREFVSSRLLTWAGRLMYDEPFVTAPTTVEVKRASTLEVGYGINFGGRRHTLAAIGDTTARPASAAESHFLDLNWAFGRNRRGQTMAFEVERPAWRTHAVRSHHVDVDWATLYGPAWAVLNGRQPDMVSLVEGSDVAVFAPTVVEETLWPGIGMRQACYSG